MTRNELITIGLAFVLLFSIAMWLGIRGPWLLVLSFVAGIAVAWITERLQR